MAIYQNTRMETQRWLYDIYMTTTFDADGGTVEETSRKYAFGQPYGSFPDIAFEGKYFKEWDDADGSKVSTTDTVLKSQTLKAVWSDTPIITETLLSVQGSYAQLTATITADTTVEWGDGTSTTYLLADSSRPTISHSYGETVDTVISVSDTLASINANRRSEFKGLQIGTNLLSIEDYGFYYGYLSCFVIPDGSKLEYIGYRAFNQGEQNVLGEVILPETVTTIGDFALEHTGITRLYVPKALSTYDWSGGNATLSSLEMEDGLTLCPNMDMTWATGSQNSVLTSVVFPDSIETVCSFYNCVGLQVLDFGKTRTTIPTVITTNCWTGVPSTCRILVPSALVDAWKAADGWTSVADQIEGQ